MESTLTDVLLKLTAAIFSNVILWYMIYVLSKQMRHVSNKYYEAVRESTDTEFELLLLKITCLQEKRHDIITKVESELAVVNAKKIIANKFKMKRHPESVILKHKWYQFWKRK